MFSASKPVTKPTGEVVDVIVARPLGPNGPEVQVELGRPVLTEGPPLPKDPPAQGENDKPDDALFETSSGYWPNDTKPQETAKEAAPETVLDAFGNPRKKRHPFDFGGSN